jgi:excinuclease ABC subunit C
LSSRPPGRAQQGHRPPARRIAGIGPARKRALLEHFGSAKAVSRASPDDLRAIDGISAAMAQAIYDFFHERRE